MLLAEHENYKISINEKYFAYLPLELKKFWEKKNYLFNLMLTTFILVF